MTEENDKAIAELTKTIEKSNKLKGQGIRNIGEAPSCLIYLGQGVFHLFDIRCLPEVKAAIQELDYRLVITAMSFNHNGSLLVNFDRFT